MSVKPFITQEKEAGTNHDKFLQTKNHANFWSHGFLSHGRCNLTFNLWLFVTYAWRKITFGNLNGNCYITMNLTSEQSGNFWGKKYGSGDLNESYWMPINLSLKKHLNRLLFCQNLMQKLANILRFYAIFAQKWPKNIFGDFNEFYCIPINLSSRNHKYSPILS